MQKSNYFIPVILFFLWLLRAKVLIENIIRLIAQPYLTPKSASSTLTLEHMAKVPRCSERLYIFMSLLELQLSGESRRLPWDHCNRWASHPLAANRVIYNVFQSANSHKNTTPERAKKYGVKQQKILHPYKDVSSCRWDMVSVQREGSMKLYSPK